MNLSEVFHIVAFFFDAVGLVFVIGAGVIILHHSLHIPWKKPRKKSRFSEKDYHQHRAVFVHRIILGLDFFIVADLIKLAFASSFDTLVQILLIVIIRTILSFFLMKENGIR
ncbi:MAG: DUF1622 domain-containing protein [Candidatus Altimarinota bacterium]